MPQLGMTMTEGSVVQWLKQPGELVEKGEMLLVVQTDKVDIEIESPCSGTFAASFVELGEVVPVGTVIGRIENIAGKPAPAVPTASSVASRLVAPREQTHSPTVSIPEVVTSGDSQESKLATPRAKKLARELGLDISLVPDYEQRGRIVEADVQRFIEERSSNLIPQAAASSRSVTVEGLATSATRRAIAGQMTSSFQTIPHFYLMVLADATELINFRESLLNAFEKQLGVRLSYTDLLLRALAIAVRAHPEVNTTWQGGVVSRERVNIAFAAQAPDRLVTPVIRDADTLPLENLVKMRAELAAKARSGKLHIDDVGDASCTLSNLGSQGIDYFNAIINPPESVVLATGRIAARPVVLDREVVPRQTIYLSLSVDHRLLDGTAAAKFLSTLVRLVESPIPQLQR